MSEPPILPNLDDQIELSNENPYAPSSAGVKFDRNVGQMRLRPSFWIGLAVLILGCIVISIIGLPIGWLGFFATIAAAIRVPLMQCKRVSHLPEPLALLFSSLALVIAFTFVSLIAFVAICIPGTLAFGFANTGYWVTIAGGVGSVLCFCTLYVLSLRLHF